MDSSDSRIDVFYPTTPGSYPLIAYAHGWKAGNPSEDYKSLFDALVSFGYIVAAHRACDLGCVDDNASLPLDPNGFAHYYKQQLLTIEWAKAAALAEHPVLRQLNLTNGVGIAGHSMGGQSTVFSSSFNNASEHGISAAVMHHAYTHDYPPPQIPFLAFTGKEDDLASHRCTKRYYEASGGSPTKGFVNKKRHADHHEPEENYLHLGSAYNPRLAQFTAAWFKLHLEKKTREFGVDFAKLIYSNSSTSLCGGGDGKMVHCEVHR
jgi:hypothetical protein